MRFPILQTGGIDTERQYCRMDKITPIYVSRIQNAPLEEVEKIMKDIDIK